MSHHTKFLIIDDDIDDREMFCEALLEVDEDNVCYMALNGHKAMMALQNGEIENPDLIFLDINMPVMNGWKCLARLKEEEAFKNIPTIIYSTSSYPEDIEMAQRLGALCFFSKPSSFKDFKKNLAVLIDHFKTNSLNSLSHSCSSFLGTSA